MIHEKRFWRLLRGLVLAATLWTVAAVLIKTDHDGNLLRMAAIIFSLLGGGGIGFLAIHFNTPIALPPRPAESKPHEYGRGHVEILDDSNVVDIFKNRHSA